MIKRNLSKFNSDNLFKNYKDKCLGIPLNQIEKLSAA